MLPAALMCFALGLFTEGVDSPGRGLRPPPKVHFPPASKLFDYDEEIKKVEKIIEKYKENRFDKQQYSELVDLLDHLRKGRDEQRSKDKR